MDPNTQRYQMDYDWLWTQPPHNDGTPATVRVTITGKGARRAVDKWLDQLQPDSRGMGGWTVRDVSTSTQVILEITSAGEDVADGIEWGTDSLSTPSTPPTCTFTGKICHALNVYI